MDRFVAVASTTTLLGFTIAFSVLLGLVTQRSDAIRSDHQLLHAVGDLSVLSVRIASEAAASLHGPAPNTVLVETDHALSSTMAILADVGKRGHADRVGNLIHSARSMRRNMTLVVDFEGVRPVYGEALQSVAALSAVLFSDSTGRTSQLLQSLLTKVMVGASLTLQAEREAALSPGRVPTAALLRASFAQSRVFGMDAVPQAQWLRPAGYPSSDRYAANLKTLHVERARVLTNLNTTKATISGSLNKATAETLRKIQIGKIRLSSRLVSNLYDRTSKELVRMAGIYSIYTVLLTVGIVVSFSFFVINVVQLLVRTRTVNNSLVLLQDFCDIGEGAVALRPETSEMVSYYARAMSSMDVETLEPSENPGQIEISLQKGCAVLERLRPFIPRGAYLYSSIPKPSTVDVRTDSNHEEREENHEEERETLTRQNLSTMLCKTHAVVMLVGTPFFHNSDVMDDADLVSRLIALVHEIVEARGGIVLHVNEDGIMCVFNASVDEFTTSREGELDTVVAAHEIKERVEASEDADSLPIVITLASAPSLVGNLIGPITTSFQVVGPSVLRIQALQPVAHRHKVKVLTDSHTYHALQASWHMRPIERMDTITAYELMDPIPDMDEMEDVARSKTMEAGERMKDRVAAWMRAWTLYESAKDLQTDLLDEAGKEFANYRTAYVPEGHVDVSLDILQKTIRSKLKELLGVDFHDATISI